MDEKYIENEVRRLAEILCGCQNFGENYRRDHGYEIRDDSPLHEESNDPEFGRFPREALNLAIARHVLTEDYLNGIAHLIGPPPVTVFTQQVALRAGVEASARAFYLMGGVDVRERSARYMNERANNLKRARQMARSTNDEEEVERLGGRLDALWDEAERLGFELIVDKRNGKKAAVDSWPPSATEMIRDMYEKFDEALGGLVYQQFSSVAHATMVGIMPSFDIPDEPDQDGNRRGAGQVTTTDIAVQFTVVGLAWVISFDQTIHRAGWDVDTWHGWRDHVMTAIRRIWTPPKERA